MAGATLTPLGQFNERVRIEQMVLTGDGQGGHWWGWALRANVWALVEPITGREALLAKQLTAVLNVALTIHFRADLSITDRILIGARVLTLDSYQDPTGRRAELRVLAAEVQK